MANRSGETLELSRTHRILVGVVVAGAVVIAAIGFAGSYAAVRQLALQKGFGDFSYVFPIGIDAGICVLLALDLLLTWIRIPFPLLRQTAWLLTAATIAFNGAAAWPDPLGVGMHAVIPVLFVVAVEAARHAVGRIADITADKHMEGVRITRWLLSPLPTFLLWRRMKLWELRSYDEVIKLEQERLVYQARLRSRFGRQWRRKAPVESLTPLRLARYGVPLAQTAPEGLAAAGIEKPLLPAAPVRQETSQLIPAASPEVKQGAGYVPPAFNGQPRKEYFGDYDPTYEPHGFEQEQPSAPEEQVQPLPEREPVSLAEETLTADELGEWLGDMRESERRLTHASEAESGGRSIVQLRVPEAREAEDHDGPEPTVEDREETEEWPTEQEDGSHLTGPARVEFHYRKLPQEEQEMSAKALAPLLAERCGYAEGTVRKYLGAIKKQANA
ncbi:DUF2637 domain-containing protein [Streptomyces sp. BH097]|uniref:DUF2637 domain-containing protein n=1 Tax=unclassified Streptomyces TaxID=2593676 RepID=UPI003BB7893F